MTNSKMLLMRALTLPDWADDSYAQDLRMWRECGLPQIVLSHKLAASLAATTVPSPAPFDIVWPWPSFTILIPDGILPYDGTCVDVLQITRGHAERSGLEPHLYWLPQVHFADGQEHPDSLLWDRLNELNYNIVVGVAIELDTPRMRERIQIGPLRPKSCKRLSPIPTSWTFQLTRDVKVDVRQGVRDYLLGTAGSTPKVQSLIRGHHKRQVYGPDRSGRKWIHIEPYWRGPEDAPIAVRSHILSEDSELA